MALPIREVVDKQNEIADWFETAGPSPDTEMPVSEYWLGLLADVRDLDDGKVSGAVESARKAGASWQQVAEALGISEDAAQERFGALDAPAGAGPSPGAPSTIGVR